MVLLENRSKGRNLTNETYKLSLHKILERIFNEDENDVRLYVALNFLLTAQIPLQN